MKKRIVIVVVTIIICITLFTVIEIINNKSKTEFTYTPLMYKICDSDSCIYLLGAIHIGDENVNKFDNKIIDAYNNSDSLAVELDMTNINIDIKDYMLENGTIDNYISDELNNKLNNFSNNHPLFPITTLKHMKLGYIHEYLLLLPYLEKGYTNDGVDSYFINLAKKDNKQIISLETYEEQLNLLVGNSDEFYIKQLEYILDNYDEVTNTSIELYNAYIDGNEKGLIELIEQDQEEYNTEEEKEFIKAIYYDRNINMSKKVEEFLNNNDKVFMTVGTAHIIGKKGIVDLLNNKYKISIVK